MMFLKSILRLLRPKQWIKNTFVLAPLVFSKELFDTAQLFVALKASTAFCLTASGVYIINDISDIEADRAHPDKKHRPLAAGTISHAQAYVVCAVLLALSGLLVLDMNGRFQLVL